MKTLLKLVVGLVVLVVILLVVAMTMLDKGAKSAIETVMTEKLGTPTTLNDINISLVGEDCKLEGFTIANPEGFSDEPFFTLGSGYLAVSGRTLMDDVIEVPQLKLTGMHVNLEQGGSGGNYSKILDALSKGQGKQTESESGKRFVVREIVIADTSVSAQMLPGSGVLGEIAPPVKLQIPEIRLKDVGSQSDKGALLSEVVSQVVSAVFVQIGDASGQLPDLMAAGINGAVNALPQIEQLSSRLTGGFEKGVGDLLEGGEKGIGKEVEKIGDGLKKGIGDLLGGGK